MVEEKPRAAKYCHIFIIGAVDINEGHPRNTRRNVAKTGE
jgi:hypothetical protein